MAELKKINFSDRKFEANGKTYLIEQSINYERWKAYRKIQVELGYDISFDNLFGKIREAWDCLNKSAPEPLSAGVILYNIMNGMHTAMDDKNTPLVLKMCALFMNTQDEDRTIITEEMYAAKAEDWKEIDMQSFFLFAISSIPNFMPNYESITQDISAKKEKNKEEASS